MILVRGLEMPQYMKTDRGNPDIEPLVREGLEKVDKAMNFKRVVTKVREASVAQGIEENPADPIPQTM
jgi:hypothetical protein